MADGTRDELTPGAIASALTGRFGRPLRVFAEVGSTSTEALAWAGEGAPEGALVVADHQTGGRGRWGRTWVSEPGRALMFSLILRPHLAAERLGLLPTALGVACVDAVRTTSGVAARLKWPNDVVVDGRKLAGILVETRVTGSMVDVAVAGVGLNVHWTHEEMPEHLRDVATSVSAELRTVDAARNPSRVQLLAAILESLEELYPAAIGHGDTAALLGRATDVSAVVGRRVRVRLGGGRAVEGVASRLLDSGALELVRDGDPCVVEAGDIEHLRPS